MALVRYSTLYNGPLAVYPSPSGLLDLRTGQPELGGGFNLGDFFDLTQAEAQQLNSGLHTGRYRIVQVDAAATAANIVRGAMVGFAPGRTVDHVDILTVGTGQTAGTYTISANTGTASIQVVVGSAGTVISATVLNAGSYTPGTVPTFTLATGGTVGTVAARMTLNPNVVTDYSNSLGSIARGLFLGPVTSAQIAAGAYMVIQEAGIGTALGYSAIGTGAAVGTIVNAATGGLFTAAAANVYGPTSIGTALDAPASSALFRVYMELSNFAG